MDKTRIVKRNKDRYFYDHELLASDLGCPDPYSGKYASHFSHLETNFETQVCFDFASRLVDKRYCRVEHFLFEPCGEAGQETICVKLTATKKSWVVHFHNVGECPFCEYENIEEV
jgi:hypothetical protein